MRTPAAHAEPARLASFLSSSSGEGPARRALERLPRPLRSALAGGAATLADLAVLALLTSLVGMSPSAANLPSLFAGACVQFVGNRRFAFRSGGAPLGRQLSRFVAAEAVTLALNALLFHALASSVPLTPSAALAARALLGNLVFLSWTYPAFRVVFRAPEGSRPG